MPRGLPDMSTPAGARLGNRSRRGHAARLVGVLLLLLLALSSPGAAEELVPAPSSPDARMPPFVAPVTTTRVSLRLRPRRITAGQRARAKVVVRPGAQRSSAQSRAEVKVGRVKVVVTGPGRTRVRTATLVARRAVVKLPKLQAGRYRVRATFLGTDRLDRARSRYRRLTVVQDTPTPTPSGWPGPSNTGVPAGTNLTAYTGPCTISVANTIIDAKSVGCGTLLIQASGVTIRRSTLGRIIVDTDVGRRWSLTLEDSEVDGGQVDASAISNGNVTILRTDIHGGHNGLECQEHAAYCVIRDSWIHDQWQPPSGEFHLGGLLVLGSQVPCTGTGGACAEVVHNTIVCDSPVNRDGGGCTGDINLLPHWGPLTGAIVTDNYLGANIDAAFCTYGGAGMEYPATNIVYRDNVFERGTNRRCAAYGPVTSFDVSAPGNEWVNNRYDDGSVVRPAR